MKNYLQHKETLSGYTDVLTTIQTLEKISASLLQQLKSRRAVMVTYRQQLADVRYRLATLRESMTVMPKETATPLSIIVAGSLGLTGDLWKRLEDIVISTKSNQGTVCIIGHAIADFAAAFPEAMKVSFVDNEPTPAELHSFVSDIKSAFDQGQYSTVSVLYMNATTVASQHIVRRQLFPVVSEVSTSSSTLDSDVIGWPIIDGRVTDLVAAIDTLFVKSVLQEAVLETMYAAHATRTMTLEHAVAKTKDLVRTEQHSYRRQERKNDTSQQMEQFLTHT